jgi:hypothetical protein
LGEYGEREEGKGWRGFRGGWRILARGQEYLGGVMEGEFNCDIL